jgi:hypothetical protein
VQSEAFPIIAEIGATLAGFAAIAGVIRSDPVDRDAAFDIAAYGAMATLFALGAILLTTEPGKVAGLRFLATALFVVSGASAVRNIGVVRRVRSERKAANTEPEPPVAVVFGTSALPLILITPLVSLCVALNIFASSAVLLYAFALLSSLGVAFLLLLYLLSKHFVLRR